MTENQRIRHIDAWRFIAVCLVILSHIIIFSNFSFLVDSYPFLRRLGRFGDLGVLIFFFISGFVICRGLIEENTNTLNISLRAFYLRRILRIFPPLYLYLAALVLLTYGGVISISYVQIANSALFLCNLDLAGDCSWFAGHTWSLAYEEQFYLVFPLFFVLVGLLKHPNTLLGMVLIMVCASLGLRFAGFDWSAGYLSHMIFMLSGCAAALYWTKLSPWCSRLSVRNWLIALILLILCVGLLPYPLEAYIKTIIYPLLIGVLVLATPVTNSKFGIFFHNARFAYLGKISYTVYLWQQLATANYPSISPVWTIVFICGVWLLAHFSYQYLEKPLIRVAHRWSSIIQQRRLLERISDGKPQ